MLDGGVVAHVAFELGIGFAPLLRRLAEQSHVQQVGLGGVGDGGLGGRDLGRDEVGFDGIGVDAVIELGKGAVEVPGQREAAVFVLFETAEFLDQVDQDCPV